MKGYEAVRNKAAWLDVSGRGKIRVNGEDRARLLHAMTTNHIEQLTPGTGCYAYFLSAQGRILADVNVLCRPDYFLLDTEAETREKVYQHLDKFIIADDVTLEDQTAEMATIAVEGPQAGAVLKALGAPAPESDCGSEEWEDGLVARATITGGPGWLLIVPAGGKQDLVRRLEGAGAEAADEEAFRTVRIENGRPRYGEDLSERYLAQEANQARALHFSKGCYLGQEIVERVRSRGQVHRILVPVRLDAQVPPPAGTKLQHDGASVAEITSAAYSPGLGKVVGLAYVRTEHARAGEPLELDGVWGVVG
ncbi:MAG: hypothetical protein M3O35_12450 [Acidobacteriota bacterium]|nr:hypothetical protein [Acidobacteriota bacterium]